MTIEIRMAAADDAGLLAGIHAECFEDHWSEGSFRTFLDTDGIFGLLAARSAGQQIASFILIRVAADEAEILTLATLPRTRRQGLASAMVSAGMRRAASCGASCLFLEVAQTNLPALQLYEKLGFERVALRAGYYVSRSGAGVGAVVMRRELSN